MLLQKAELHLQLPGGADQRAGGEAAGGGRGHAGGGGGGQRWHWAEHAETSEGRAEEEEKEQ